MALIPLIDCYDLLDMDAKTLRTSLKRAGIVPTPHPSDARIKCLTTEQLELLASRHARTLRPTQTQAPDQKTGEQAASLPASFPSVPSGGLCVLPSEHELSLVQKLALLESRVAQLSEHLTSLTLLLLKPPNQNLDARLSRLEAILAHLTEKPLSCPPPPLQEEAGEPEEVVVAHKPARPLIPAEEQARSRMPPLIEYSAQGTYVIVSSLEGELALRPDSPEWFEWLATLTSFRFVGQAGRLTAYRNRHQGHYTRGWTAYRCFHGRHYKHWLGITDRLTIACLEQMAAALQSRLPAL